MLKLRINPIVAKDLKSIRDYIKYGGHKREEYPGRSHGTAESYWKAAWICIYLSGRTGG